MNILICSDNGAIIDFDVELYKKRFRRLLSDDKITKIKELTLHGLPNRDIIYKLFNIKLLNKVDTDFPKIFISIDGGIIRDISLIYRMIVDNIINYNNISNYYINQTNNITNNITQSIKSNGTTLSWLNITDWLLGSFYNSTYDS